MSRLDTISGSLDAAYTLTNSTAPTTLGAVALVQNAFPPNNLSGTTFVGPMYLMRAFGFYSSAATTPGNLTLSVVYGTTTLASAVVVLTAGAANYGFKLEALVDFEAISATASSSKVTVNGILFIQGSSNADSIYPLLSGTSTPPANQLTVDTTSGPVTLQIQATFSTASASNTVTVSKNWVDILE